MNNNTQKEEKLIRSQDNSRYREDYKTIEIDTDIDIDTDTDIDISDCRDVDRFREGLKGSTH